MRNVNGRQTISVHRFARLVASETAVLSHPLHSPIVLVVPNAAAGEMHLPRMLAHLTERTVWATDGELALVTADTDGHDRESETWILLHRRIGADGGRWLRTLPTDLDAQIARIGDASTDSSVEVDPDTDEGRWKTFHPRNSESSANGTK